MIRKFAPLLAGASLAALATPAAAQSVNPSSSPDPAAQAQSANEAAEERGDATIIVTARRRAEDLLDVPQTVNAVTAETAQEYNILNVKDIGELIPGLTLESNNQGFAATAQVRGVNFQVTAQGSPTIEMYLNEVPIEPNTMFQAQFDIGQIEVLRGPQGTLRGRSAPSGALTNTTRRPDLTELGGYMATTLSDEHAANLQAALNFPLIPDVLGLRIAGVFDRNDAGGVRSVTNQIRPREETGGFRATLRFEPTSSLSAVVMYQRLNREIVSYGEAQFGTGASGLTNFPNFTRPATTGVLTSTTTTPAALCGAAVGGPCVLIQPGGAPAVVARPNFNGPVLLEADARGTPRNIADFPSLTHNRSNIVTAQIDWAVAGQKLSYVGGYVDLYSDNLVDSDATNSAVGVPRRQSRNSCCGQDRRSHELRLSSDERLFEWLDYTLGAFYSKFTSTTINENLNQFVLPGAFGSPLGASAPTGPGTLSPLTYDSRYTYGFTNIVPQKDVERGLFGNLMLHLGDSLELSAGARQIWRKKDVEVAPVLSSGLVAIRNPNATAANPFAPCPATLSGPTSNANVINGRVVGSTYPGTCDVEVLPGNGTLAVSNIIRPIPRTIRKASPFVYNFSASYKFSPDHMVYATYGTSWRQGPGPVIAAPNCASGVTSNAPDPTYCERFNILQDERSKGFEVGFKGAFFARKLNVSIALYQQDFKNFFIRGLESVPFLSGDCTNLASQLCTIGNGTFTYNADAKVRGVDFESNLRLNEDLSFAALFSWSRGKFKDTLVPCRDTNFDGVPDSGALPVATPGGQTAPQKWVAAGGPYGPALCPNFGSSTTAPPWNASVRGEYSHEVVPGALAFVRGLFNYYPRNKNQPTAISVDATATTPAFQIAPKSYSVANLWLGLRGEERAWEISVAVRNLFNSRPLRTRSLDQGTLISPPGGPNADPLRFAPATSQNAGYRTVTYLDGREFQLSLRWNFGSR